MDDYLPKHCIVSISYLKGISKQNIIEDGWFDVDSAAGEPRLFFVEKKGKKFRFRDGTSETTFGSWEHVVEDAQKSLGEDPKIIRQVLTVAGVGDDDQIYDDFEVVQIEECESISVDSPESDGGVGVYGLAGLPKRRLEKTIAVHRGIVTDWDEEEFPDDDHEYDDSLECISFIFPEDGDIDFTQEDTDIYKELAEQDNSVAQYLLGLEYKDGALSEEDDSQRLAQQWLHKAAENGSGEAERLLDEGDSDDSYDSAIDDLPDPEFASQYEENELLRQTADLDVNDCLVEIRLLDKLSKETLFMKEQFSLDDQSVTLRVYKHNGQIGLVRDNEVQFFDTESEFVAACLRETGEKLNVMTVVLGLAFCGFTDYWTAFDGKVIQGTLGTQELNLFEPYNYECLSKFSAFALFNGFAICRRVAPDWKPGQTTAEFDEAHDSIAVITDQFNGTTLFKEDWEILQNLVQEGNPNAMLALAQVYYSGDIGEPKLEIAEDLALQAQENGCQSASRILEEINEWKENYSD